MSTTHGKTPARAGAPRHSRRSRRRVAVAAAALSVLMVMDPFGLGNVAGTVAWAEETVEDRAANVAEALSRLPQQTAEDAVELTGSWPEPDEDDLPVAPAQLPNADEETVVILPDAAASAEVGGMHVEVAEADTGTAPEAVTVRVEDPEAAEAAGITGVLLEITDATEPANLGDPVEDLTVDLTVSYAEFAGLVGGDWATRLRLVYLPDCDEQAAGEPECQPQPLPTVNDPIAQTVTGTVPVNPVPVFGGGIAPMTISTASMSGRLGVGAGVSGSAGDWSRTGLPQSSSWGASGNMGGFTWSYPLEVPSTSSGLSPELTLSYSSAVSDGRTPSANNQSGWIGEGFDLTSSYVERTYKPCAADEQGAANNKNRLSGDLCWGPANATMVLKGASTELVYDSGDVWRSKSEDGTRAERLTGGWHGGKDGEYWKVTTPDGTQYFFGRGKVSSSGVDLKSAWTVPVYGNHSGEPCYSAPNDEGFAKSHCSQVWRWNLDHVVDPSGNTMTYTYATETNAYVADFGNNTGWTPTSYISGGRLAKIEYGTRTGQSATAPYRVVFDAEDRCVTNRTNGASLCAGGQSESAKDKWLDTPTDLQCKTTDTDCGNVTPVFFDTTRLAKITAQAWNGSAYRDIDSWAFTQRFVGEGNDGQVQYASSVMLRLDSFRRTGHGGTTTTADDIAVPPVQFGYVSLANRVDSATDGQSALWRHRVIRVRTESGGAVNVNYRAPECTPGTVPGTTDSAQAANTKLCYLVKWQPDGEFEPQNHWFHKYVVDSIVEDGAPHTASGNDLVTGSVSQLTRYVYSGGAAWAKPKGPLVEADEVTYSEFRGYARVDTIVGEGDEQATVDRTTYFRGNGDELSAGPSGHTVTVTDREEFAGQVFVQQSMNGSAKLSETVNHPAAPITVATGTGGLKSTRIPSTTTYGFTYDASGSVEHRTRVKITNDAAGLPITVDDRGDLTTTADDVCTKTTYRRDSAFTQANMLAYASQTEIFAANCDGTLTNATLISRDTATYDSAGRVTETRAVNPDNAGADVVRSKFTYDAQGRVTSAEDAAGNKTTTAYTAGPGGQLSKIVTTSPDPDGSGPAEAFTSTQTFNPLTGLSVSSEDQNGQITTGTYDALGRLLSLRLPEHADAPHPSVEHSYRTVSNGLNAVATRTLGADGVRQHTSVILYDGMGRPFQQQVEGADAFATETGRMVSHVYYDSAGRMEKQTSAWWAKGAPGMSAIVPIAVPPSQTTYVYDKAGRVTDEVFWDGTDSNPDYELWRTKIVYDGATTLIIPPAGGVPSETVADARGRVTQLREYVRDPDTHAGAVTASAVRALTSQTTSYTYNAAGEMTKMTNPAGDEWLHEYDLAGRNVSSTDPDSGTTTIAYDVLGQVTTRQNANGDTLAYTYDALGRVTSLRDDSPSGAVRAVWEYDASELVGGETALGQLSAATRFVDGKEYTTSYPAYDAAYRPLSVETALPEDAGLFALSGRSFTTQLAYTADGQVAQVTYPQVTDANDKVVLGGETVTTRFDDASMPSWMSGGFGWGTYVADARWAADGKPLVQDLGNTYGAVVSYAWDEASGRLAGVRLDRERVNGTELNLSYHYDKAGNITGLIDAPSNTAVAGLRDAQCFKYDGLQRLKLAWTDADADCGRSQVTTAAVGGVSPYWTEYAYDQVGNRTVKMDRGGSEVVTTTYEHGAGGAGPHQLTSVTESTAELSVTTGFTWDAAGNQTSRTRDGELQSQVWDAEGELVGVTTGAESTSNVFDANGSRLIRADGSGVTVFLPGGQEVTVSETSVSAARWYSFAGSAVAVRTGVGMAGVSSVVADHNGSPVAYVHNTEWSDAVSRVRMDPFGVTRTDAAGSVAGRGYLGAPADSTGLTLLGARFYDAGTGTFVSVDPLLDPGVPAQFNAYVYSGNNPVTWADPSGLSWLKNAWNNTKSFVSKYKADITGFVVGTVVTAGCLAVTGGVGSVGCLIAGGAAGAAVTNVMKQTASGKPFSAMSLAKDTLIGAAGGLLGPAGKVLAKPLAAVSNKITTAISNVFKPKTPAIQPKAPVAQPRTNTTSSTAVSSTTANQSKSSAAANTGARGAENAANGARLNTHLRQLEKYGQAGYKRLESGRFRYYGDITPASTKGEMVGRRLVREWDPASGATRTWHETLDQAGRVRIVRPETGGPKIHYYFDDMGNYGGSW